MLPPELEEAKTLVEMLIGIKPFKRKTNLEYLERNKEIVCPVNYNHHIKKNGHKNETQRIWCYDCKKSYTITYNTILSHSTLNYEQFKKMLQCMYHLHNFHNSTI